MVLDCRRPALLRGLGLRTRVELFGVPRVLLGRKEVEVEVAGASLRSLALALGERWPELHGRVIDVGSGWLLPGYSFAVDGRFTRDPATAIGKSVLLVASSAGG